eukprot:m.49540 g.49540  ORF g.49540 m.49540 type:complete len:344 (-) comp13355_c0_seq1:109-1140(-)
MFFHTSICLVLLSVLLQPTQSNTLAVRPKSWQKHLLDGCEHAVLWNICIRAHVDIGNLDMDYNHLSERQMYDNAVEIMQRHPQRTVLTASSTTAALKQFYTSLLPKIKTIPRLKGIVMVIMGDSTGHNKQPFLDDSFILHLFAINLVDKHPKAEPIPLGMDFHGLLRGARHGMPATHWYDQWQEMEAIKRKPRNVQHLLLRCYSSGTHPERSITDRHVPHDPSVIDCKSHPTRSGFWNLARQTQFVLSPRGSGIDCHRTWEALYLGAAIITKRIGIPLEQLYKPEPALLLDDWRHLGNLSMIREAEKGLVPVTAASDALLQTSYWLEKFERTRFLLEVQLAST